MKEAERTFAATPPFARLRRLTLRGCGFRTTHTVEGQPRRRLPTSRRGQGVDDTSGKRNQVPHDGTADGRSLL